MTLACAYRLDVKPKRPPMRKLVRPKKLVGVTCLPDLEEEQPEVGADVVDDNEEEEEFDFDGEA